MGQNSQTTNQQQSSQFQPWQMAIPGLTNLFGQITDISNNANKPTAGQGAALNTLQQEAGGVPSFGPQAAGAVNNLFNTSTQPNQGLWNQALQTSQGVWNPILTNPNFTNPYNTPGFGDALKTMNQDITNQITGQWAAAGRDPVGNAGAPQALARGLSQGEGGLIANQSNILQGEQLGAANAALTGAGNTATGTAQLQQLPYMNQIQAMTAAAGIPGLWTAPGQTQLGAANTAYGLPYQNLQMPLAQEAALGGMGGSSSGWGTSTTTQPINPFTTALGIGLAGVSLFPSGATPSDRRLKKDIKKIGKTPNDLGVYSFKFKGSEQPQVGLMAQDVEKKRPGAVKNVGLWKAVDYSKALAA